MQNAKCSSQRTDPEWRGGSSSVSSALTFAFCVLTSDSSAPPTLLRRLDAIRRRLLAQRFLDALGVGLLVVATLGLIGGIMLFRQGLPPVDVLRSLTLREVLETAVVLVVLATLAGATTREAAAALIDRLAGTHDRFHTALAFSAREGAGRTPLEELTLAECVRYIDAFPVRRWVPLRPPRTLWFVAAPLVSLALLCWHESLGIGRPPRDAALAAAVAQRADALQTIADRLHPPDEKSPQPELNKVADAMKRSAQRLKEAADAADAEKLKTALKELSSLEAMLNAMKAAAQEPKVSPAELNALAAALAATPLGKDAADAIQQGKLEKAAGELEKLLQQMQQQGDAQQALQQLAQAMQEQASKLTEAEKNAVAQQMEQAAQAAQSGQAQLSQEAMQRLADLMRQAGKNGANSQRQASSGSSGKPMTAQQMQSLLNALENMKDGLQQPGGDGSNPGPPQDGPGEGQSLALVESFTKNGGIDGKPGDQPSGVPGGEHDSGHPDKLFADTPPDAPKIEGQAHRLEGVLGNGESLQELVNSPSGPAKASRRYRELYEAMAPGAQNTVEQENIPLGSRNFVRRYFENIRPQN